MYRSALLAILFLLYLAPSIAQTQFNPFYDARKGFHFGFVLGTNFSDARYRVSDEFREGNDVFRINVKHPPGITIAAVINYHVNERLDLRTYFPSIMLSSRTLVFTSSTGNQNRQMIESVYLDLPLLVKYKSERHQNLRFYVVGGGKYSFDIASKENRVQDPSNPILAYRRHSYSWIYGCGLDMYFEYFKLSPELTICNGLNNMLTADDNVYTQSLSQIHNRTIMISFHFE